MEVPPVFLDLISKCSLDEKKSMLEFLIKDVQNANITPTEQQGNTNPIKAFDSLVNKYDSLIKDELFLKVVRNELDSLNLQSPQSSKLKVKSMWFTVKDGFYYHDGKNLSGHELEKYPALSKLRQIVNSHHGVKQELDCCNVICLSNNKKSVRLHADNESYLDQSCPIATVTIGATRKVEFVPFGRNHQQSVVSLEAEHNSLYVMNAGCQSILQHRVTPGNIKESGDQIRYSISFRKFRSDQSQDGSGSSIAASIPLYSSVLKASPKVPTSLIVGDSFAARLDANRLSKGTKNIINIAKGGYKIPDAIESLDTFHKDLADKETIIDQVFISIGTNDIRHSRREGVGKFKSELFKLIRRIKELFPRAKIFFQSLIPLPITRENESYVARNLLQFNSMLFDVCKHEKVYMFDVFGMFLLGIYRNPRLFPEGYRDIHPNKRGLGLLAREYIKRIHCKNFDPFRHN